MISIVGKRKIFLCHLWSLMVKIPGSRRICAFFTPKSGFSVWEIDGYAAFIHRAGWFALK